jgi:NAD(P)-dependent dehydrogenase (short-subunit alcohol dehydrogenase family)
VQPGVDSILSKRAILGAALFAGAAGWAVLRARRQPATRSVLVTGGSRGLGLCIAREYLARGAYVAICARDPAELDRGAALLGRGGRSVLAIPCDVGDAAQASALVREVEQRFGALDTLVNNAGVIQVGPMEHMTRADYDAALRVHLFGPLHTTDAALPGMRERRRGRIVNVSSIAGLVPVPHMLPYTASKFALTGWSEGLAAELAGTGIRVTTVCPSLIRTGSPRNADYKGRHREEYAWFSISDSLPLVTMDAQRAARRIVRAAEHGRARLVLPLPFRVPVALHGVAPELTLRVLGLAARWLPEPGGVGAATRKGRDSASRWSPSWLTHLDERAAREHNEVERPSV